MGEMGKGEMGTAHAGKPPSLPRELRTPLVSFPFRCKEYGAIDLACTCRLILFISIKAYIVYLFPIIIPELLAL
jgi:hypothetical protein